MPLLCPLTITGLGAYVPQTVETAEDLAPRIGRPASWILEHTGVARRHIQDRPIEQMAALAAKEALGDGPPPDMILYAATTPRQLIPDTSIFVARELGLDRLTCHTVHATCLSFLAGLHAAAGALALGTAQRILVVSAEVSSTSRSWDEPESSSLLGDAAAAAVVERSTDGSGLLAWRLRAWPRYADYARYEGCGAAHSPNDPSTTPAHNTFRMNGTRLYRAALVHSAEVFFQALGDAGLTVDDLALLVPHQTSGPGLEALSRSGLPPEKIVNIIAEYGNCVAASIPLALTLAAREGRLKRGDHVMLFGTASGLSIGAAVLRW